MKAPRNVSRLGQKQGVYARPSAAIERGSGFFFPGLEGPKVRLVFGGVLLTLTAYNHVVASSSSSVSAGAGRGDVFSELLAVVYSVLVLLQGALEFRKEGLKQGVITDGAGPEAPRGKVKSYQQLWSVPVEDETWRERVQWAATTYLSLTPATHMMLLGPGTVVYSLGETPAREGSNDAAQGGGCQAALDTLAKSTSGRVALPPQHPAVTQLTDPNYNRCVVLQRVDNKDQLCWLMSSDRLLAGFSPQDLQWLGQLAKYVDPSITESQAY